MFGLGRRVVEACEQDEVCCSGVGDEIEIEPVDDRLVPAARNQEAAAAKRNEGLVRALSSRAT